MAILEYVSLQEFSFFPYKCRSVHGVRLRVLPRVRAVRSDATQYVSCGHDGVDRPKQAKSRVFRGAASKKSPSVPEAQRRPPVPEAPGHRDMKNETSARWCT